MEKTDETRVVKPLSHSDIEAMVAICAENLLETNGHKLSADDFSKNGFLRHRLTIEEAQEMLKDEKNYLYLILKNGDKALGYLFGCDLTKAKDGLYDQALQIKEVQKITGKIFYHRQIAKTAGSRKVGEKLLLAMMQEAKNRGYSHVICKIVHKPFYNQASISFHQKFGFRKIAETTDKAVTTGIYLKNL